jgi:creatinine amidohydrolase/Fe(II)-dependent formamide hydrolase-like protein
MAHGGEFETSLIYHLYPGLVREDADAEYLDEPYERGTTDLLAGGSLSTYRPRNIPRQGLSVIPTSQAQKRESNCSIVSVMNSVTCSGTFPPNR